MANFKQYELVENPTEIPAINETGDANTLRRGTLQSMNYVKNQKGWRLNESGLAEFLDADVGGRLITISSVNDLQGAINELVSVGGGKVFLKAGTYNITTAITGDSSVTIEGASASSTILNFGSTSANISFTGTSVYTTGTITVASGVNITGSGTSWLANVTTSHQLFLGTRWYKIAAITSDTTLILSEAYGDNVTLPSTYRIVIPKIDINFKEVAFQSSTGTGLVFTDCRNVELDNVNYIQNNKGFVATNVSEFSIKNCVSAASTSNGYELTNCGLMSVNGLNAVGNGGHGAVLNNVKTAAFFACSATGNTTDGFNCTTVDSCSFAVETSGNGGQGIEFVSGCNSNSLSNCLMASNTSDGIKLTATSDGNIIVAGSITANGGYGINIAASTCDNNTVVFPYYNSNTSGTLNDAGTGTIVPLSAKAADVQTFTNSGTWTKPTFGTNAVIQLWGAGGSGGKGTSGLGGGGGGGGYIQKQVLLTDLTGTVTVTLGDGGVSQTTNDSDGFAGGNTTFGAYLTAYGGGGGGYAAPSGGGGGGGGEISVGGNATGATAGSAGLISGGKGGTGGGANPTNPIGIWGGGGGSASGSSAGTVSAFGGGGGGAAENPAGSLGGVSLFGGNGGRANTTAGGNGTAGSQPGGGGGGSYQGNSGAGGKGKVIITVT